MTETKQQRYDKRAKDAGFIRFELKGELAIYEFEREAMRLEIKRIIYNSRKDWAFAKDMGCSWPKKGRLDVIYKDGSREYHKSARNIIWKNVVAYRGSDI